MRYGSIPGVEKRVSRLVLGTMIIADGYVRSIRDTDVPIRKDRSFGLLDAVFALGCTAFDADEYIRRRMGMPLETASGGWVSGWQSGETVTTW